MDSRVVTWWIVARLYSDSLRTGVYAIFNQPLPYFLNWTPGRPSADRALRAQGQKEQRRQFER